jgi:biopolymer transport protein ExbD
MNFSSRNKIKVEGGMASMTDLVFLLLIFFIIMSLMANNQTPIDLPKPDESLKPVKILWKLQCLLQKTISM